MDDLIRVLHVQHSLDPGGMENGVVNVASKLDSRGFEFHVCCLERSGAFADRLPDPKNVYPLGKGDGFSLRAVWQLYRLIRRLRPHVVHTHNLGALIYAGAATFGGRWRPILHGEHGQPDDGIEQRRRLRQRKRLFRIARKVHTVSHSLRDFFLSQGFPAEQILPLVNGVDTERFVPADRQAARREVGIPESARVAVVVGRLIHSKGHLGLFKAFEGVVAAYPDAILLVVGAGGSDEAEIASAASSSPVAPHIRMEGFRSDPRPFYAAADVLISPSTIEGLSNVVLEAMACGLPGLLHDACGNREVIRDGIDGIVADLSTEPGIERALIEQFQDPAKLQALGQSARVSVVERFSLDRMADAYAEVYIALSRRKL
jgi:glycosyltransferase involved in cell wall biosynthesis